MLLAATIDQHELGLRWRMQPRRARRELLV
jgi:hypothetical protein